MINFSSVFRFCRGSISQNREIVLHYQSSITFRASLFHIICSGSSLWGKRLSSHQQNGLKSTHADKKYFPFCSRPPSHTNPPLFLIHKHLPSLSTLLYWYRIAQLLNGKIYTRKVKNLDSQKHPKSNITIYSKMRKRLFIVKIEGVNGKYQISSTKPTLDRTSERQHYEEPTIWGNLQEISQANKISSPRWLMMVRNEFFSLLQHISKQNNFFSSLLLGEPTLISCLTEGDKKIHFQVRRF